ncbi:MAG: (2Fe-2S) ferredoxin domain-containing protein [Bacteroidales bacterium]|nr:(2Fe-2S) ferredoxin domain-containing protein [Bacteroidales bacterium]MBN2761442.1 (2Fe-2S) ferredoxin domain-containing protein [Bacteroidales bacterium]
MTKIKNMADLKKLKEQLQSDIKTEGKNVRPESLVHVKIAMATCSIASGSRETMNYLVDELEKRNIDAVVTQTGCMGYCYAEPTVEVTLPGKEPVVYGYVDHHKADEIIEKYIKNGILLEGIIPVNYRKIDD